MEMVNLHGQMEQYIKGNLLIIGLLVKEFIDGLMEVYMKDKLKMG